MVPHIIRGNQAPRNEPILIQDPTAKAPNDTSPPVPLSKGVRPIDTSSIQTLGMTYPKVRQSLPILDPALNPLLPIDQSIPVPIKYFHNNFYDILLLAVVDLLRGLIIETVCAPNVVRGPRAAVIVVMEGEEGGGVEIRDVMFFCRSSMVVSA